MIKKLMFLAALVLLAMPAQAAEQTIWGATDRAGTVTEMRLPVDTGASSSPGYMSMTLPSSTGVLYNSGGTLAGDADLRFISGDTLSALKFSNENGQGPKETDAILRVVCAGATAAGNVGTGEDDLITCSIPADTLFESGKIIQFRGYGTAANNENAKTVKCYFGATTILTSSLATSLAQQWEVHGDIIRTGANTQDYTGTWERNTAAFADVGLRYMGSAAETESGAITLKCTGTATSDNDIVMESLVVIAN